MQQFHLLFYSPHVCVHSTILIGIATLYIHVDIIHVQFCTHLQFNCILSFGQFYLHMHYIHWSLSFTYLHIPSILYFYAYTFTYFLIYNFAVEIVLLMYHIFSTEQTSAVFVNDTMNDLLMYASVKQCNNVYGVEMPKTQKLPKWACKAQGKSS